MIDQPTVSTGTMTRPTAVGSRQPGLVSPHPPGDDEKYLYTERNQLYLTTVIFIGSCCLIYSQIRLETHDLLLAPFLLFTVVYVLYQAISLPVNFAGRGFDLATHQARIRAWSPTSYPAVDIYLPICGEPIELLHNTWTAAAGMMARGISSCGREPPPGGRARKPGSSGRATRARSPCTSRKVTSLSSR